MRVVASLHGLRLSMNMYKINTYLYECKKTSIAVYFDHFISISYCIQITCVYISN